MDILPQLCTCQQKLDTKSKRKSYRRNERQGIRKSCRRIECRAMI